MKVLLTWRDNGEEKEDYQNWPHKAYLVPDDFSRAEFEKRWFSQAKLANEEAWLDFLETKYQEQFTEIEISS